MISTKTLSLLCLPAFLSGLASLPAQVPAGPHPHSLSLHAELASGGSTVQNDENANSHYSHFYNGVSDKTKSTEKETTKQGETIQITLRNLAPLPDNAQVEWYFVAAPVKPDASKPYAQQESIFDQGAQNVTLAPGATVVIPAHSKDIDSTLKRHVQGHMQKGKPKRDANWEGEKGSIMKGVDGAPGGRGPLARFARFERRAGRRGQGRRQVQRAQAAVTAVRFGVRSGARPV